MGADEKQNPIKGKIGKVHKYYILMSNLSRGGINTRAPILSLQEDRGGTGGNLAMAEHLS